MTPHLYEPLDAEHGKLPALYDAPLPKVALRPVRLAFSALRALAVPTPEKFVTRATWGARPAKANSGSFEPARGGTALHWEGPDMDVPGPTVWAHTKCAGFVRSIQNFHMDGRGWVDIAYSAVVCPHGYIYEGRWVGKRTAANGTNDGNLRFYAVCYLGGSGDAFPTDAKVGMKRCIRHLDIYGGAGPQITYHQALKSTACPGKLIIDWIKAGCPVPQPPAPKPPTPTPTPTTHKHDMPVVTSVARARREGITTYEDGIPSANGHPTVKDVQGHINYILRGARGWVPLSVDGKCGDGTVRAIERFQATQGLTKDGVAGPITRKALHTKSGGRRLLHTGKGF